MPSAAFDACYRTLLGNSGQRRVGTSLWEVIGLASGVVGSGWCSTERPGVTLRSDYHAGSGSHHSLLPCPPPASARGRRRNRLRGSPPPRRRRAPSARRRRPRPGHPARAGRATSAIDSGIAGSRCRWCRKSSVARRSRSWRTTERRHQQGGAAGVGGRIGVRHRRRGAGRARPRCATPYGGTSTTAEIEGSTGAFWAQTSSPAWPQMTNPPSSAGATLSGWPSSRLASASASASSSSAAPSAHRAAREHDAPDDGGRGRAQAAAVRDPVGAGEPQSRGLLAHRLERGPHRAHDQVGLVAREVLALPLDEHLEALGRPPRRRACRSARARGRGSRSRVRGWRWWPGPRR